METLSKKPKQSKSKGFALIVSLSLMVLLTIIALGLLSLSSVSLRASAQTETLATARANARLALAIAIGELQKSLGPDKAITASSDILSENPAKPNLTGVWSSWDPDLNTAPDYDSEKEKHFQRWLVSSAEPTAPEDQRFADAPWSGKSVELVGNGSLGENAPETAKVTAGLVPINWDGKPRGAYAWHVADESTKARINLYRDPDQNAKNWQKRALTAGQRPDTSFIKGLEAVTLDFLPTDLNTDDFKKAEKTIGKVIDLNQASLLGSSVAIGQFRNDVTPYSMGILTDVRKGGLKQDLGLMFENGQLPNEYSANNGKLYQTTSEGKVSGPSDPYWSALMAYYNSPKNITGADTSPTYTKPPTSDAAKLITDMDPPKAVYPGPVIAKIETLYSFMMRDAFGHYAGGAAGALGVPTNQLKYGYLIFTPIVTLHNPYNVSISFDKLKVTFGNMPIGFNFLVNGQKQCSKLTSSADMFLGRSNQQFVLTIADWASAPAANAADPSNGATKGAITMLPGQTLLCSPFYATNAVQADIFYWEQGNKPKIINAAPGLHGNGAGYGTDWITPYGDNGADPLDRDKRGVLGLKETDSVAIEIGAAAQVQGSAPATSFSVSAQLTVGGSTIDYGGMKFEFGDQATLSKLFPQTFETTELFDLSSTYVPEGTPIIDNSKVRTFALFSAYARTTNGGVSDNDQRSTGEGVTLTDGRLAGKPFLFHSPAKSVISIDLKKEKPGTQSHELNFQRLVNNGDDVLETDGKRTNLLTGNRTQKGIKSGSYLELPTGPLQTIADFRRSNVISSGYQPSFVQPIANSMASPLLSTSKVIENNSSFSAYPLLDHSALANQALYDHFYFSTIATYDTKTPDQVFSEFMDGSKPLISQAFEFYLPSGKTQADAKADLFGGSKPSDTAYQKAAEYQLLRGPFNVNSTSVQAWKAMLASTNKSEIITYWAKSGSLKVHKSSGIPILGMSMPNGGSNEETGDSSDIDDAKTNEWNGYRELQDSDLETLATEIVKQVRERGPFLSMAEFVNRRVGSTSELTLKGTLQSAIDNSKINDSAFANQIEIKESDISDPNMYGYTTPQAETGNPAAGAPGWISQGDLMRILEPAATVRSDTFVIRVCGEAWDSNGKVAARAYAEAVVQRSPEYVDTKDRPSLNVYTDSSASAANKKFGRRMNIIAFRWLNKPEI